MTVAVKQLEIVHDAPISTWFRVGGRADRYARPRGLDDLRRCLEIDRDLLILGEGANLLVSDEGVGELVVSLDAPEFGSIEISDGSVVVEAMAGARLPKLISTCVRAGLGGLETLAGIPASVGGAVAMNAGGAFGQVRDCIEYVRTLDRDGDTHQRTPDELEMAYRSANLHGEIVTSVRFRLEPGDPGDLHDRLVEVMGYKKSTQPMSDRSAGCAFRNPSLTDDIDGIGERGERISAGKLIDMAGCKGLSIGGATVSELHGNFIVTRESATASDVVALMVEVAGQVRDFCGISLKPEVVIWRRSG